MTKLLIVDDNEQNLYMLQVLLKGHGYQTELAEDGARALEIARRDPPDMIITDILMPVMDGFALCREWKQDEVLKAIPFVFYTATYTDPKDEEFALSLGAERFIVKPQEPDVLIQMLYEVIEQHEAGQQLMSHGSIEEEPVYLRQYNEVIIRKLENKLIQLEEVNRRLENEVIERKQAEEELRETRDYLDSLIQYANAPIVVWDPDRRISRFNTAFERLTGYTADQVVGLELSILFPETSRDELLREIARTARDEYLETVEIPIRCKEGETRQVLWNSANIYGDDGKLTATIAQGVDITGRKQAEEALRESEKKLRVLFEILPVGISVLDKDRKIVEANTTLGTILDLTQADLIEGVYTNRTYIRPDGTKIPPEEFPSIRAVKEQKPVQGIEIGVVKEDGDTIWTEVSAVPLSLSDWKVVTVTTDIAERKQTEEALQRYADRLQLLREVDRAILSAHSPELIAQNALRGLWKLVPCQRASVTLFDFETETFTVLAVQTEGETDIKSGMSHPLIHFAVDFEKLRQNQVSIEEDISALAQPTPTSQTLTAEGLHSSINVPLMVKGDLIGSLNLLATNPGFFALEFVEIAQEVAGQLAVAIQQARLYEELQKHSQELEQAVEEATAELREANEALKTLDQLKDSFLSTAAHELRTPLTSIQGFSEILLTRELDEDRKKYYLDTINKQSTQLAQIINDLLDISRLEAGEGLEIKSEPVDLGLLLVETVQLVSETSVKHHFRLEGLTKTPPVQGDPFRLEQVIKNLLSNAVKYSPEGGNIRIYTRVDESYLEVGIQDEGIGLTPEQQAHLFERFYRADGSSRSIGGTGLGLALCKLIVEGHGGHIWAESESGAGSTFAFTIPLAT